jgi:hypothetical protein
MAVLCLLVEPADGRETCEGLVGRESTLYQREDMLTELTQLLAAISEATPLLTPNVDTPSPASCIGGCWKATGG